MRGGGYGSVRRSLWKFTMLMPSVRSFRQNIEAPSGATPYGVTIVASRYETGAK